MSDLQESSVARETVLIIGAGLEKGSLRDSPALYREAILTAFNAGIKYALFEREPANLLRPRDWNMGLHWGAPILETLIPPESFAELDSAQVDPSKPCPPSDTIKFFNGKTGEQIGQSVIPHIYRVRRSRLRTIISQGLDIHYSKVLSDITYSKNGETVTAHFEDGTSFTGCILIGADGHRSTVRKILLGAENAALTTLPFAASIVQAKYTAEQVKFLRSWHPLYVAGIHPIGQMGWVGLHYAPDPEDPENWIMNHYISWACSAEEQEKTKDWTNEMRLKQVKSFAAQFADPFRSAYEWLKDDQQVWYAPLTQWDPSLPEHQWNNYGGRVTLAGDAAHPMTFQRGQGLNSAFKDASEILAQVQTFVSDSTSQAQTKQDAINAYEEEMKLRAGTEVRLSAENTRMVHVWDEVMKSPLITKGFARNE